MGRGQQAKEGLYVEGSAVISEHQFATHYSSAWHLVAPFSEGFWAFENKLVDRIDVPLQSLAPKGMRAIINEAAFRTFCDLHPRKDTLDKIDLIRGARTNFQAAISYVARFSNAPPVDISDIDPPCEEEAAALIVRLLSYFRDHTTTTIRPGFAGCGLLSACEGDLIEGDCLYEVKAGDRAFRILDLRQLLTYSALAYASGALSFTKIGLFNPRTGVAWKRSLEEVCHSISGLRPNDTLSALIEQFSVASASR
jgi:hypothetical protein